MQPLRIPCPQCGQTLKLRDRARLGKPGKCPKCRHKFVLEDPHAADDEVTMELVDAAPAAARAAPQPAVGTSPRWIPDEPVAAQPADTPPNVPHFTEPPTDSPPLPDLNISDSPGVSELQRIRRRSSKGTRIGIAVGAITALLVTLAVVIAKRGEEKSGKAPPGKNVAYEKDKKDLQQQLTAAKQQSPTSGQPIGLLYVPSGARIIINLHPAELWKAGSQGAEFRACLGGAINTWAESSLKEICRFEPAEIDEAMICLLPQRRGTPPEIAAVVHLAESKDKSEFLDNFAAVRDDSFGKPLYLTENHAFNIIDDRTFAVAPRDKAGEMYEAMKFVQATDPDVEKLLNETDRDRHFTFLFRPHDLRIYQDVLVPQETRTLLNLFVDWFGEDVSAVAWSLHLGREKFHSEMLLRNAGVASPRRLHEEFDKKLGTLPRQVLGAVQKMNPRQVGFRKIIGRFPAMLFGYAVSTDGGIGDRHVQLTTVLPERAAPNLAAGLVLTWNESLRTDFTKEAPKPSAGPKLPDLLVDRLKAKVEVDFRRTPLHEAFAFIADETKVKFDIDGDALKDKGMTQNMAQNLKLGVIPAVDAIHAIIGQYKDEGMCVVVDEKAKLATVTTLKFVDMKGIKESSTVKILKPTGK